MDFFKVDKIKILLDKQSPLPKEVLVNLREVLYVEWIFNSNAMHGSPLSLLETKLIIEENLTIPKYDLTVHYEAVNYLEAIQFIEIIIKNKEELNEELIKKIHHIFINNVDSNQSYRDTNFIKSENETYEPPHFHQVQEKMNSLLNWYLNNRKILHPVELAATFHLKFISIQPFLKGNNRTAYLLYVPLNTIKSMRSMVSLSQSKK